MRGYHGSQGPPPTPSPLLRGHLPYCKSLLISCLRDCWGTDLQSSVKVYSHLARFGQEQEPMCFCWSSRTQNPQGLLSCFHLIVGSFGERQTGWSFLLPCDVAVCWTPFQKMTAAALLLKVHPPPHWESPRWHLKQKGNSCQYQIHPRPKAATMENLNHPPNHRRKCSSTC